MRILREPEVLKMVGLSRVTIWRWQRDGKFPKRRRLGASAVGWLETEVEEWIEEHFQTELSRKLDEISTDNSRTKDYSRRSLKQENEDPGSEVDDVRKEA